MVKTSTGLITASRTAKQGKRRPSPGQVHVEAHAGMSMRYKTLDLNSLADKDANRSVSRLASTSGRWERTP